MRGRPFCFLVVAALFACVATCQADELGPARNTETVQLVRRAMPAVVSVRTIAKSDKPGSTTTHHGSGVVIHPQGYVLTIAHVLRDFERGEVEFLDHRVMPYQVVGAFPQDDLALLRLEGPAPFPWLPLGRSHDLALGEPALVLGNAAELGHSVSTGVISGLGRSTHTDFCFLPEVVQTSAAINGGNSGGPLINAEGELIGIVVSKKSDADNIGFAVAVDRIRRLLPGLVAWEARLGARYGFACDPLAENARVQSVTEGSPAAGNLAAGDVILEGNGHRAEGAFDLPLQLLAAPPAGRLSLAIRRGNERKTVTLEPAPLPAATSVAPPRIAAGLKFARYAGKWQEWPTPTEAKPLSHGTTANFSLPPAPEGQPKENNEHFLLVLEGLLKIPQEGTYTFGFYGSGGCRCWIGEERVAQTDRVQGTGNAGGAARLAAGLHRVRCELVHSVGKPELTAWWNGPGIPMQKIPPAALFHEP